MKTLIFLLSLMMVTICATAQGASKPQIQEIQKQDTVLIMKEGKVLLVQAGKNEPIETDVLVAGTKINIAGEVIYENGTRDKMQEGDVILSDGKLVRAMIKSEKRKEKAVKV